MYLEKQDHASPTYALIAYKYMYKVQTELTVRVVARVEREAV